MLALPANPILSRNLGKPGASAATPVSSVADAAVVTRATVYNHPDLRDLVKERMRWQNDTTHRLGSRRDCEVREIARLRREAGKLREQVRWREDLIRVIKEDGLIDIGDESIRLD